MAEPERVSLTRLLPMVPQMLPEMSAAGVVRASVLEAS